MKDGGPVYPQILTTYEPCRECEGSGRIGYGDVCLQCGGKGKEKWTGEHPGMSLRDHFAAVALQGIISNEGGVNHNLAPETAGQYMEIDAKRAYAYSDAMLKARDQS